MIYSIFSYILTYLIIYLIYDSLGRLFKIVLLSDSVIGFVVYILVGIALIKLKEIELSKITGYFTILIGITTFYILTIEFFIEYNIIINIIGTILSLLSLVAYILMIIMFFRASKKFEK